MQVGVYRHYKGGLYQVLGVGEVTDLICPSCLKVLPSELVVVYVSLTGADLKGPRMRVRPLDGPDGWNTPVVVPTSLSPPEHDLVERFVYVGNSIK